MRALQVITSSLSKVNIQVILLFGLYILFAKKLPLSFHQFLYSLSLVIKDLIMIIMPALISVFIAHSICSFREKAKLLIIILLVFELLSNSFSIYYATFSAYINSKFIYDIGTNTAGFSTDFKPLWQNSFSRPDWWSVGNGAILGLIVGYIFSFNSNHKSIIRAKDFFEMILVKFIARVIPIFMLGFIAQMYQTRILNHLVIHYGILILWLVPTIVIYIMFLFLLGNNFNIYAAIRDLKNLLPASIIAFSAGSSLSAMPWTIEGSGKNLKNPNFARIIIPATSNIQQIGDCIVNVFLCFLIYKHFYGVSPEVINWVLFTVIFALARFATAAVIGGAIFIMLPIYIKYLNFNPEMVAIILALNMILDPIVTCSNVLANGALCKIFEKVWHKYQDS